MDADGTASQGSASTSTPRTDTRDGVDHGVDATNPLAELDEFKSIFEGTLTLPEEAPTAPIGRGLSEILARAADDQVLVEDDVIAMMDRMVTDIDAELSAQMDEILHHPDFQAFEGAWRGLAHTVDGTATGEDLEIHVMDMSKEELWSIQKNYGGEKWDKSPIFEQIYARNLGTLDGDPVSVVVGDYHFGVSSRDIALLEGMGKICETSMAPFISAAAPGMLGLDSWDKLNAALDDGGIERGGLADHLQAPAYKKWRALRENENMRFVGLTLPRVLARAPYAPGGANETSAFAYREDVTPVGGTRRRADTSAFTWMNAAHAMAVNINKAFEETEWASRIAGPGGGGTVEGLPRLDFDDSPGTEIRTSPFEIGMDNQREGELSEAGFLPLQQRQGKDVGVFMKAQSIYRPKRSRTDADGSKSDHMSANLAHLFTVSRLGHLLHKMAYERIGSSAPRQRIEDDLNAWVRTFKHSQPQNATEEERQAQPLVDARVEVHDDPFRSGHYDTRLYVALHDKIESMNVGVSLSSNLSRDGAGG
ncbi:MAG: type VI secretion system contractile sheath large subunit [Shimia sp.]